MRKLLFIGPVLTNSGYGVHSRQLLKALNDSGQFDITVESLRWGDTGFVADEKFDWIRALANKPSHKDAEIAVQVSIANEFSRRAPMMIGVTAGIEVDRVSPQWLLKCNAEVDLVIVPSEHSRKSFMVEYNGSDGTKLSLNKPIFVVPEGVDTDVYFPTKSTSAILDEAGIANDSKNFVFVGLGMDKPQGRDRKNITKLVEYFCKTFAGNKNVGLILKSSIVNNSAIDFEMIKKRVSEVKISTMCGEFPKIHIVHGRFREEKLAEIYNDERVIAAVSLTHGEGYGLPLIEAAACALPVVATNWSGHLDFLSKNGKKLFVPIEYNLEQIYPECVWEGVMDAGTKWAVPIEQDVTAKLQKMVLSSATPRKWAEELMTHIHETLSVTKTNEIFLSLVNRASAQMPSQQTPAQDRNAFVSTMRAKIKEAGKSLLYTMPMSAGDVFLSTGVVAALSFKFPEHKIYFATSRQYFDILKDVPIGIHEVIEWQQWMQDVSVIEEIFDEVYTPNLAVQMISSNWIHSGKGRNLIDEFATQCNVKAFPPRLPVLEKQDKELGTFVAVHSGGQKSARAYSYWSEVVKNLRANGIKVIQVGALDDTPVGTVDVDMRGKTNHKSLASLLSTCEMLIGIDSYPMHVANAVGIKVVAIFGSSYKTSTGPKDFKLQAFCDKDFLVSKSSVADAFKRLQMIETTDRNGCEKACYKDTCKIDTSNPCINNIKPEEIFSTVFESLKMKVPEYKSYSPKISGYTHILNPKTHGYPFVQSIASMLGFCDEVIVVDGGSADDSLKQLKQFPAAEVALSTGRLKIIKREWDYEEPGMDGMQKAFARAMCDQSSEFLWQQDADEVVHEDDYAKIKELCKRFPADVDVMHLPVVELWGDQKTCRTDRHSWKWRLTRNNMRVTHGINAQARAMDPKTGRIFSKPGMSDGCELIDMVTGNHLPHRGFYTNELEALRLRDPVAYGKEMNVVFSKLPSVWHYSWADLPRKVKNFRDFWDKQWSVLYQSPAQPRFPDVKTDEDIITKSKELLAQGGEHSKSITFDLTVESPSIMKEWNSR